MTTNQVPPTWDQLRFELELTCAKMDSIWSKMGLQSELGDWRDWACEQIRKREELP